MCRCEPASGVSRWTLYNGKRAVDCMTGGNVIQRHILQYHPCLLSASGKPPLRFWFILITVFTGSMIAPTDRTEIGLLAVGKILKGLSYRLGIGRDTHQCDSRLKYLILITERSDGFQKDFGTFDTELHHDIGG